jgi:hypothetical protein
MILFMALDVPKPPGGDRLRKRLAAGVLVGAACACGALAWRAWAADDLPSRPLTAQERQWVAQAQSVALQEAQVRGRWPNPDEFNRAWNGTAGDLPLAVTGHGLAHWPVAGGLRWQWWDGDDWVQWPHGADPERVSLPPQAFFLGGSRSADAWGFGGVALCLLLAAGAVGGKRAGPVARGRADPPLQ